MTRTALIFGITGQDGSYLAEHLLGQGYKVIGVARRVSDRPGRPPRIAQLLDRQGFELVSGDVTDPFCVQCLLGWGVQEVYNLAAQSHVGTSFGEPSHTTQATYQGAMNILEGIRCCTWPGPVRFYQASSSEMFGSAWSLLVPGGMVTSIEEYDRLDYVDRHPDPRCPLESQNAFQDERTPMLPNSPYAVAKLSAHHLCRIYRESYGIFACSGILFNHESERRGENFVTRKITLWAGRLYDAIVGGQPLPKLKLGNIDAARDWGHAEDYVRGMHLMLQQDEPDDYVLATGEVHTVREFLDAVLTQVGVATNRTLVAQDLIEIDPDLFRPSEVPYLRGYASKARSLLGWKPQISFPFLVKRMVEHDRTLVYSGGAA